MKVIIVLMLYLAMAGCAHIQSVRSPLLTDVPDEVITENYLEQKFLKDRKLDDIEGIYKVPKDGGEFGELYESAEDYHKDNDLRVMIIKNPNTSESDYIGIITGGASGIVVAPGKEKNNACVVKPGDLFYAFNKSEIDEHVFFGISQSIIGDTDMCGNSEPEYTRFVFYEGGKLQACKYIYDDQTGITFTEKLKHIDKPPSPMGGYETLYDNYRFYTPSGYNTARRVYPALSTNDFSKFKKNNDSCKSKRLFGKAAGFGHGSSGSSGLMSTLITTAMAINKNNKSYSPPRGLRSGVKRLHTELLTASAYFFQSQENLLRAYGKDTEAAKVSEFLVYIKNTKYSETDRLQNSMQLTTETSEILKRSIKDDSYTLSEESRAYYAKGLQPIQQGLISTAQAIPLLKDVMKTFSDSSTEDKIIGGLQILGILPELPQYLSTMFNTMGLAITGAKTNKIEGAEDLEVYLDDLDA